MSREDDYSIVVYEDADCILYRNSFRTRFYFEGQKRRAFGIKLINKYTGDVWQTVWYKSYTDYVRQIKSSEYFIIPAVTQLSLF